MYDWIHAQTSDIPIKTIYRILSEVAAGITYLHSIKEENTNFLSLTSRRIMVLFYLIRAHIFFFKFDSKMKAKIFDFGLYRTKQLDLSYSSRSLFEDVAWLAPEYLAPKRIEERNNKGDVFAFGVVAWELLTRKTPWEGVSYMDVISKVKLMERPGDFPRNCPELLKKLVLECWSDGK